MERFFSLQIIEYEDGTPATQSQVAKDIATFLVWTASPEHDVRKKLFIKVGCREASSNREEWSLLLFLSRFIFVN